MGSKGDSVWGPRETVFGVQGDCVWGPGGRYLGSTRSLELDIKYKITGVIKSFEKRDQDQTDFQAAPDNIYQAHFLKNSPFNAIVP